MANGSYVDLAKLATPFHPNDLEWRAQRAGSGAKGPWVMVVPYITNPAIMQRFDDVVGAANWSEEFKAIPTLQGVMCGITLHFADGRNVTKWDGSGLMGAKDGLSAADAEKGTITGAEKRAAMHWGVGRYLYYLDATFAQVVPKGTKGATHQKLKDGGECFWVPPSTLPEWALPAGSGQPNVRAAVGRVDEPEPDHEEESAPPPVAAAGEDRIAQASRQLAEGIHRVAVKIPYGPHKDELLTARHPKTHERRPGEYLFTDENIQQAIVWARKRLAEGAVNPEVLEQWIEGATYELKRRENEAPI
jgi:hypothetical protein